MHCFNTTSSTYRHKNRGLDVAVVGVDDTGTGIAASGV